MPYAEMSTEIPWSLVKGGFKKTPNFSSMTQKPAAGRGRSSITLKPYATWDFELDLNYIQGGESVRYSVLQKFLGCYLACCGGAGFFLFTDPNDNAVQANSADEDQSLMLNVTPGGAPMGQSGDGTSTQFQLARSVWTGVDILQNVSDVVCFVEGAPVSASIGPAGIVTFATAPPTGAILTWQGNFRYLCQFTDDTLKDLARVSKNSGGFLWSASVVFESVFV